LVAARIVDMMNGRIIIKNARDVSLLVRVEPWADEHEIPPNEGITIKVTGPDPADLEVSIEDDVVTVYGWTGSILDADGDAD
jgi:hypothetical protein